MNHAEETGDRSRHQGNASVIYREASEEAECCTWAAILLILIAIPFVIFFSIFFLNDRSEIFISLCIIGLAMIPFAMVFEQCRPQARELLLIAVMSAIAVVGRMAFFMIPQFKPVVAIVIIAGVGLGQKPDFLQEQ